MHDIFISYSSKDREWVAKLAKALEAQGYEVWWDPEILPGQHYQDVIQKALHGAKSVIAVWTGDSVQSDYVRAECLWAFGKRNLISVLGKDAEIPTPFNAIQAADLRKWKGSADDPQFQRLLRGIRFAQTGEILQPPKVESPQPKSRMGVVFAGVAAVAVAGAGVYWQQNGGFGGEYTPAVVEQPAKPAAKPKAAPVVVTPPVTKPEGPKSYQLAVKTTPENTAITVDGNAYEVGKAWKPGTYTVKAVAEGYKPVEQAVTIKDQDAQVSLTLEVIRYALTISAKPETAKIILSGGLGYSPGMLLPPGDYVVKVEADGYQSQEKTFTITANDETLNIELKSNYRSPLPEGVVATVNGVDITEETFDSVANMVKISTPNGKVDNKALLDDLITTELARQEANKSGLAEREDIKDKIKEFTNKLDAADREDEIKSKVKDFTDRLVLNTWTQVKAASFKPTDEELKKAYAERTSGKKFEYKARHILMKTKEEAQGIIKELENKVDFADLAKKSSDGPSAGQGGDLGWFKPDTMVKPFAEAVVKMEPGTITKEPVQTDFGWHVIKLEERRDVKPPEFDTLKSQLEREYQQKKMLAYIEELRSRSDINVRREFK